MLKKFIKKIGKGIKKVGKAIGKPFKKLMKTKIGKIIGTIGMMMIGGWMFAGAKAFVGGVFAGQGVGASFASGVSAMGNAAAASYSTITGGIKGMFGDTAAAQKTASENLLKTTVEGTETSTAVGTGTGTVDVSKQAVATTETKLLEEGAITSSGKVVGDDALAGSLKRSLGTLPEPGSAGSTLKWDTTTNKFIPKTQTELMVGNLDPSQSILDKTPDFVAGGPMDDFTVSKADKKLLGETNVRPGKNFGDRIVRKATDQETWGDTFADWYHGDIKYKTVKDTFLGGKPFKGTNLPGFIREGTVGEGLALHTALATPEEQYQQGRSDMTGAYEALNVNVDRLYTGPTPSMTELADGRTSIPSPSVVSSADYLNNSRKAGFIWDTSLLAVGRI